MSNTVQATLTGKVPETRLVNMKREDYTRKIDRSTRFGSPFRIKKDGGDHTREESVEKYREWFNEKIETEPAFREAVEQLRGETLGCWCKPKACHGDVIVEYLRQ